MGKLVKVLIVLAVLSGGAAGVYGWLNGKDEGKDGITLITVENGTIVEKATAVGQIEPRLEFKVKSKISGIVARCFVEVGDRVQAGDPLFEITPDPTPSERVEAEGRLEKAQATLKRAEADWSRASELSRQGILSRDQLDAREEEVVQARIDLGRATDALALIVEGRLVRDGQGQGQETLLRAPAGGTVLTRPVNPGDPIVPLTSYQEGTVLATVADMGSLLFRGTVDEIDVGKLTVGVPARLKVGAMPDAPVSGTLRRIAPQAIEKEGARLFQVEIELEAASSAALRAGYSANADVVIREKKDVLILPERLVTFDAEGKKATVEVPGDGPDSPPKTVEIVTGLSDGLNIEVVSGLKSGDKVVQRPPKEIEG